MNIHHQHPERVAPSPVQPCDHCPIVTWAMLQHPETVDAERAIRRSEQKRIADMATAGVRNGELIDLVQRLDRMQDRRTLGTIVHQLLTIIEQERAQGAA